MSLFAQYIKEARKMECLENEKGFASFLIDGEACYIEDVFVHPDHRRGRVAWDLAEQIKAIAKERGCTHMLATFNCSYTDPSTSLMGALRYGAKVVSANNNVILAKMEI